eukprot:gnl/TRDRNA2_/TRDRNA2_163635_c0_seq2.p1 gnl/TRDRNA2_/TRDRNA2_163635_c0~~gnl/TRDRNA2_/TRDRNA2_163635_c0_seq2.p1  ORF type:complete len:221 (+),score=27.76 gnl/TRDRNA2_/TRDRNA2_163635_c0_seq2:93-755(+)
MNPKEGSVDAAFAAFRSTAGDSIGALGEAVGAVATSTGSTISALSAAWSAKLQLRDLGPSEMKRAGLAINNMIEAGYSKEMAYAVCRAVFGDQTERQLRRAYRYLDHNRDGNLDLREFRQALAFMGEQIQDAHIEVLFARADRDGTGRIDFPEFCSLVRALNPKDVEPTSGNTTALERLSPLATTVPRQSVSLASPSSSYRPRRSMRAVIHGGADGSATA